MNATQNRPHVRHERHHERRDRIAARDVKRWHPSYTEPADDGTYDVDGNR